MPAVAAPDESHGRAAVDGDDELAGVRIELEAKRQPRAGLAGFDGEFGDPFRRIRHGRER